MTKTKTDGARGILHSGRLTRIAHAALVLASACSLDNNGLREPASGGGSSVIHQAGSGGVTGTGGPVAGGTNSGGSGPSSSGGASVGTAGRSGTGGAGAAASGGASGGSDPGHGGSGVPGAGGAIVGGGGTTAAGGAKSAGGSTGSGGVSSSGGVGIAGGAGSTPSGGRGGAAGGAGGASIPTCGPATCANGCCEGNTCITVRTDVRCGKGGAACAPCQKCFRCANTGSSCEIDPASTWRVMCSSAVLSATQPNGQPWDGTQGGGPGWPGDGMGPGPGAGPGPGVADAELPDPTCRLSLGQGTTDGSTSVLSNTLTPTWNESITPVPLTAGQLMSQVMPWSVTVADDDEGLSSDLVCRVTPQLTAADFAAGEVVFTNAQSCTKLNVHLICVGG